MKFGPGSLYLLAAAASLLGGTFALAQTPAGPFTQAQVTAGRADYADNCAECHGDAMQGAPPDVPALTGQQFRDSWSTRTTRELWQFISNTMPDSNPGSLTEDNYLNLVAYILAANGAKPGTTPFASTSVVKIDTIADGKTVAAVINPTH